MSATRWGTDVNATTTIKLANLAKEGGVVRRAIGEVLSRLPGGRLFPTFKRWGYGALEAERKGMRGRINALREIEGTEKLIAALSKSHGKLSRRLKELRGKEEQIALKYGRPRKKAPVIPVEPEKAPDTLGGVAGFVKKHPAASLTIGIGAPITAGLAGYGIRKAMKRKRLEKGEAA